MQQKQTKEFSIPAFKTLHPLSKIKEAVDFPDELKVEGYEEDKNFVRYREMLTNEDNQKTLEQFNNAPPVIPVKCLHFHSL